MLLLLSETKSVFVDSLSMNINLKVYYFNEIRWNGYRLVSVLEYINITRTPTSLFCLLVVLDNSNKDDRGKWGRSGLYEITNEFLALVVQIKVVLVQIKCYDIDLLIYPSTDIINCVGIQ